MQDIFDFEVGSNDKDPKFEVGDHIRTSKYKSSFANDYNPNWTEGVFVIKNVKLLKLRNFAVFYRKKCIREFKHSLGLTK